MRAIALGLAMLAGCDDGGSSPAPEGCTDTLVDTPEFRVVGCADDRSVQVFRGAVAVLDRLAPGLASPDVEWRTDAWPTAAWQSAGASAKLRLSGHPDAPALEWTLTVADGALTVELVAIGSGSAPVYLRVLDTPDGVGAAIPHLPASPGPWLTDDPATTRLDEQFIDGSPALWLGGGALAAPVAITIVGQRVSVSTVAALDLAAGEPSPAARVQIRADDEVGSLIRAVAAPSAGVDPPPWGWRSRTIYGARVDAAALRHQAEALAELAEGVQAPPWVLADGQWSAAIGDWQAGDGFADGLGGALSAAPGAPRLALRWPAQWVDAGLPLRAERPGWFAPGVERGGCAPLSPQIPAVRDRLARDFAALRAAGVEAVFLTDVVGDRAALANLVDSLAGVGPVHVEGLTGGASYAPAALAAPASGCPGRFDCVARACPPLDPAATPEPAPGALRPIAFALAQLGHRAAAIDLGPIELAGRAPGAARQAVALAALAGGPYLLGDDLHTLSAELAEIARAPIQAGPLRGLPTTLADGDDPPREWRGERVHAVFNWTDAPISAPFEVGFEDVFGGPPEATVPAGDVRLLYRP